MRGMEEVAENPLKCFACDQPATYGSVQRTIVERADGSTLVVNEKVTRSCDMHRIPPETNYSRSIY